MNKLLSALFLLALCSSLAAATTPGWEPLSAAANIPDADFCTVTPNLNGGLIVAPTHTPPLNGTTMQVNVRNGSNVPIQNATVEVVFDADIRVCGNADLSETTDIDGNCTIYLGAGGCIQGSAGAAIVFANSQEIKNYQHVKSPDNAAHTSSQPNGQVNTVDLPFFADEYKAVQPPYCHDYDNNGACNTADLPYFGDAYKAVMICP